MRWLCENFISLRSKRFRAVSEQRKTEERDTGFWPREKWNESQKIPFFSTPSPLTRAIFRAVFAPKQHGFALFMESECIAELNPSASCWPLTRCFLIYQQTSANQNTVHLKTGFIWKFSREWLFWTGYASGGSLRKKPKSPIVKPGKQLVSSLVGCLLLFLKIYVLKIG